MNITYSCYKIKLHFCRHLKSLSTLVYILLCIWVNYSTFRWINTLLYQSDINCTTYYNINAGNSKLCKAWIFTFLCRDQRVRTTHHRNFNYSVHSTQYIKPSYFICEPHLGCCWILFSTPVQHEPIGKNNIGSRIIRYSQGLVPKCGLSLNALQKNKYPGLI